MESPLVRRRAQGQRTGRARCSRLRAPTARRSSGIGSLALSRQPKVAILNAVLQAVVFDLDGVLIDSEPEWDRARRQVAAGHGGTWRDEATAAMQGMSSVEWSRYMRDILGIRLASERISDLVVANLLGRYRERLPLIPGAGEAVHRLGQRWPLGLASSANRVVIDTVLAIAGLQDAFRATVSSEEVRHGKPAPDVYLEAARRLGQPSRSCGAIEDSANGIRSAAAAGMRVVAIPSREYPPPESVLASASEVVTSLADLTVELLDRPDDGEQATRAARDR